MTEFEFVVELSKGETDRGKKVRHLKQLRRSHCDF